MRKERVNWWAWFWFLVAVWAYSEANAETLLGVSNTIKSEPSISIPYFTGFISGFEEAWVLSTGIKLPEGIGTELFLEVCQYEASESIEILVLAIKASAETPDMQLRMWLHDFLTNNCLIQFNKSLNQEDEG